MKRLGPPLRPLVRCLAAVRGAPRTAAIACAALIAFAAVGGPAAASGQPDVAQIVHAEVLPGWRMADGHRMAALKLTLAPGWHTYWRAPGDAGIPPAFDWSKSANLKAVALHWPVPRTFDLSGLRSIGYEGGLILPIELTPKVAGKPIALDAKVDIGVCRDICLPASLTLHADLSGAGEKGGAIAAALSDGPETASQAGVKGLTCTLAPSSDGLKLTARMRLPALPGKEVTVVELPDPKIWVSEAKTTRAGSDLTATADIVPPSQPFALDRSQLTITVLGQGKAVELHGCPG